MCATAARIRIDLLAPYHLIHSYAPHSRLATGRAADAAQAAGCASAMCGAQAGPPPISFHVSAAARQLNRPLAYLALPAGHSPARATFPHFLHAAEFCKRIWHSRSGIDMRDLYWPIRLTTHPAPCATRHAARLPAHLTQRARHLQPLSVTPHMACLKATSAPPLLACVLTTNPGFAHMRLSFYTSTAPNQRHKHTRLTLANSPHAWPGASSARQGTHPRNRSRIQSSALSMRTRSPSRSTQHAQIRAHATHPLAGALTPDPGFVPCEVVFFTRAWRLANNMDARASH